MSAKYNGGAAFPHRGWDGPNDQFAWPETGMSLRDWFAGQALIAFVSGMSDQTRGDTSVEYWASVAYETADAMIARRSK